MNTKKNIFTLPIPDHYLLFPFVIGIILLVFWLNNGDHLYDCTTHMSSDKSFYSPGDTIMLTVKLIPHREKSLRLFENPALNVLLSTKSPGEVSEKSFRKTSTKTGNINKVSISANSPLIFHIVGKVRKRNDQKIILDFGEYGSIRLAEGRNQVYLTATIYPAIIQASDRIGFGDK